ncbi:serine hydrolase [Corynebacterium freiburgense]|uniref:serine hydrolase n=1 Tax=Corynebacterium freiburgense TaxID=556548 RepID=UPI00040B336B|nr:serine hydrolase domain-containing protein [Corynebacterium freiburgense]WJZ03792.1 beta-lactam binding protein AmpH [Corynebacterium freiburgense]
MKYFVAIIAVILVLTATEEPMVPPRGDEELAAKIVPHTENNRMIASMAVDKEVTFALVESSLTTPYRVSNLTELFTIELYYAALRRGDIREDTKLGALVDVPNSPASNVTLRELAEHTGGFAATDNESLNYQELLHKAKLDPLESRGRRNPSTIGISLLGHALAIAAKTDYPNLLKTRFTEPMGLVNTRLLNEFNALSPAVGGVSTVQDIGRFARYTLESPEWGNQQWVQTGSAPDFQSALAVQPGKRAVVVLSRGNESVEQAALEALK